MDQDNETLKKNAVVYGIVIAVGLGATVLYVLNGVFPVLPLGTPGASIQSPAPPGLPFVPDPTGGAAQQVQTVANEAVDAGTQVIDQILNDAQP